MVTTGLKQLFTPMPIGPITLQHRIVMAPLTRSRSEQPGGVPGDLMLEYYTQRASSGGLIIGEATSISPGARGWYGAPGFYSAAGWRRITDAVHSKGGFIFGQLWHTGRSSHIATSGSQPVSASVNPDYWADPQVLVSTATGWQQPSPHRALEIGEIAGIIDAYRVAAVNAKRAGFDGVELHAANGYLIDQFLQDSSNQRTDRYGGPIENRTRLLLEVVAELVSVWGADRVAVRIGPGGTWNKMGDSDSHALFSSVAAQLDTLGLAYLHVIEPRVKGNIVVAEGQGPVASQHLRTIFHGPVTAAGGFEPDTAEHAVACGDADLITFGRHFISNPDLPRRIRFGLALSPYDRATFYTFDAKGYVDYPAYADPAAVAAAD